MTSLALKNIAIDLSFSFQKYPVITICGKRSSGKTELAKYIIKKHFFNVPLIVVSTLGDNNTNYLDLTKSNISIDTFDTNYNSIINTGNELTIVIDDIDFKSLKNSKIPDLFTINHHKKINIILVVQYMYDNFLKSNIDYLFLGNESNYSLLRSYYSKYPFVSKFDDFIKIFNAQQNIPYSFILFDLYKKELNYIKFELDKDNLDLTIKLELTKNNSNKNDILNMLNNLQEEINKIRYAISNS